MLNLIKLSNFNNEIGVDRLIYAIFMAVLMASCVVLAMAVIWKVTALTDFSFPLKQLSRFLLSKLLGLFIRRLITGIS